MHGLQVDFLTAELLRHNADTAPSGEMTFGRLSGDKSNDEVSRAAALELEIARLATQLRTALAAQQRAEDTASALKATVSLHP